MMYVVTGIAYGLFAVWLIYKGKKYFGIHDDGFDIGLKDDE